MMSPAYVTNKSIFSYFGYKSSSNRLHSSVLFVLVKRMRSDTLLPLAVFLIPVAFLFSPVTVTFVDPRVLLQIILQFIASIFWLSVSLDLLE